MKQSFFARFFPTPKFLRLGTVGLDFSDATVRMIELKETPAGIMPKRFGEWALPEGVIAGGRIADETKLVAVLRDIQKEHHFRYARVSISEPQIYSFSTSLDIAASPDPRAAIELILEDNIPLKLAETIFDYEIVATTPSTLLVQVTAMSAAASESLVQVLSKASVVPVSFELEGEALARAVLAQSVLHSEKSSAMIVDFGAHRTGVAIVSLGVVVFTSTIDFGGSRVTDAIAKALSISSVEAEKLKRDIGLSSPRAHPELYEAVAVSLNILKEEINRRYIYWHEKRTFADVFPNADRVFLSGGDSNLLGLDEYLRAALRLEVERANPWENCVSFDNAIPPITRERAMSFATAIGLALLDFSETKSL